MFALSVKTVGIATGVSALAALILWVVAALGGANVAQACYLTLLMLISTARAGSLRTRVIVAAWSVAIAMVGFLLGSFGLIGTLTGLLVVCLTQGVVRIDEGVSVARAPVNLVVFAGLSQGSMSLGQATTGALFGAILMLLLTLFLPVTRDAAPGTLGREDSRSVIRATRVIDSLMVALGSSIIVMLSSWLDFPYSNWALLSLCMILAVDHSSRRDRARARISGTLGGVVLATAVAFTPSPTPMIVAVGCVILCVAYQLSGNYALFVAFLTPALLLLTTSESSILSLGGGRIVAILASALIALACTWVAATLTTRVRIRLNQSQVQ